MNRPERENGLSFTWGLDGPSVSTPLKTPFLQRMRAVLIIMLFGASLIGFAQKIGLIEMRHASESAGASVTSTPSTAQALQIAPAPTVIYSDAERQRQAQMIIENCTKISFDYPLEKMGSIKAQCILSHAN